MERLKWKYDSKEKHWYINESCAYSNDGMCIANVKYEGNGIGYRLHFDNNSKTFDFKKLESAKIVAQLIKNG